MADEIELETKDLQETIEEIHKERAEREKEEHENRWTRYIALTTAILATFGAVGAMQSGGLANEGMMHQLQASDTWNEYQASKEKTHIYGIAAASLLDAKVVPAAPAGKHSVTEPDTKPESSSSRLGGFLDEIKHENQKTNSLNTKAKKLEKQAEEDMSGHHKFAYSVALLQVGIALGAVAALTRMKSIWMVSLVLGIGGLVLFFVGFYP
jgi:hypothetical protein